MYSGSFQPPFPCLILGTSFKEKGGKEKYLLNACPKYVQTKPDEANVLLADLVGLVCKYVG